MRAAMFLADVTQIDLAYITPTGTILGSSISPKFVVSGEVTKDESVVVDFSKIKKKIKALIDDNDTGYDHKLWLFNNTNIKPFSVGRLDGQLVIETDHLKLALAEDAVKVLDAPCSNMLDMSVLDCCVEVDIESYLTEELGKEYPGIQVGCKLGFEGQSMAYGTSGAAWFRYTHGLKDSSSYGCQNSSHGHLSYLQLLDESRDWAPVEEPELLAEIARDYNGTVFINAANVVQDCADFVEIHYESHSRGFFAARYNKNKVKTHIVPTETTIEYLVEYIKRQWWHKLKSCKSATHLAVSEGLVKGAMTELS